MIENDKVSPHQLFPKWAWSRLILLDVSAVSCAEAIFFILD